MEFKVDPNLEKFLSKGLDEGIRRGMRKSLKETRTHVMRDSVKELKKAKFLSNAVPIESFRKAVFSELSDQYCTVSFSEKRQNLWRVPFKTYLVRHPKIKGLKLTRIETNIGGNGFKADALKPFWKRKKGQPLKPLPKQKPIALYREGSARLPVKLATAPSLSRMIDDTGLGFKLQLWGNGYLLERMKRNVNYFLDQMPT